MREGDILKEKKEYLLEKFQSKQGLLNFFIGTAVWWAVIIAYVDPAFDYFFQMFEFVGNEWLAMYLSYLAIGVVFSGVGYGVSFAIIKGYEAVKPK